MLASVGNQRHEIYVQINKFIVININIDIRLLSFRPRLQSCSMPASHYAFTLPKKGSPLIFAFHFSNGCLVTFSDFSLSVSSSSYILRTRINKQTEFGKCFFHCSKNSDISAFMLSSSFHRRWTRNKEPRDIFLQGAFAKDHKDDASINKINKVSDCYDKATNWLRQLARSAWPSYMIDEPSRIIFRFTKPIHFLFNLGEDEKA